MKSSTAKSLNHEIMEENWITILGSKTKSDTIISNIIPKAVTPPDYMWDKISSRLDKQMIETSKNISFTPSTTTLTTLIIAASLSIAAILYFLL